MKYVTGLAAAVTAAFSLAGAANAGELQDVSVTLSTYALSQPATLTMTYRTVTSLSPGSMLSYIRTAGVTLTNGQCSNGGVTVKLNDVTLPISDLAVCSITTGQHVQINTKAGHTVPANTLVTLIIDSSRVETRSDAGTYPFVYFETAASNGTPIDTKTPLPSITLGAPPPPPVPTFGEWAMILFGTLLAGTGALWIARRKAMLA